jgi:hypothetical protein
MTDYVRALEAELVRAGRERQRRFQHRRRVPRLSLGGFATALAAGAAVAVALVAIVLAGHHRNAAQTTGARNTLRARQLISKLAVLRRPQTAADQAIPAHLNQGPTHGPQVVTLTRLVATPPGARVFLVVNQPPATGPIWSPRLGDQVAIVTVNARGAQEGVGEPAANLTNGMFAFPYPVGTSQAGRPGSQIYEIGIVPDGVARVRWAFAGVGGRHPRAVNATVADNVAISALLELPGRLTRATWYAADGHQVQTSDRALRRAMARRQALARASLLKRDTESTNRAAPVLLRNFAVFAPTLTRNAGAAGITVTHPSLSSLPLGILNMAVPDRVPGLAPEEIRQVTTRSGLRFWVVPGAKGACVAIVEDVRGRPGGGAGSAASCSGSLAQVEANGIASSATAPDGTKMLVGAVPDTNSTVSWSLRGGGTRTVPVVHGVFVTRSAGLGKIHVKGVAGAPAP